MAKWIAVFLFSLIWTVPHQEVTYTVDPYVQDLEFPVAMAFTPDGRLFYTEKINGRVRMISAGGRLQEKPVFEVAVDSNVELGMLGIAVDPNYDENGYLWVSYVQPNTVEPPTPILKLVRLQEEDGTMTSEPEQMLSVPIVTREQHHVGGNVHFDDEGYLYLSIGDMGQASFSQQIDAMQGRIHRFAVQDDTLVPAPDNPFPDNSTFAYGLRNPFDFDFDPQTGEIISGENGPHCDDELNLVLAGGNYGWREDYPCDDKAPQNPGTYVYPLTYWTPTEGITGVLVYDGEMFPDWQGTVFVCGWKEGKMFHAWLTEDRQRLERVEPFRFDQTCSTDVEVGPDGGIYFTNFDSIYRITKE